ncbi:MAG: hypothetical protein ACLP5H_30380 [Desulfomonilaceae bacterium]
MAEDQDKHADLIPEIRPPTRIYVGGDPRIDALEEQVVELQKQVAALTKMLDRVVRPANKVVSGILSAFSAVKEHHKGSENP